MPRARGIKPAFFKNDSLAEVAPLGRLLFIGLWCEADRAGRLMYRPKRIKAEYLPYDDADVPELMRQLEHHGFIAFYTVDGSHYVQVLNFVKHQHPHHREPDSELPAFDSKAPGKPRASTGPASGEPQDSPGTARLTPDSGLLTPDNHQRCRFDEFWSAYPRKVAKKPARQMWEKRNLDQLADRIIADVKARQANDSQWQKPEYIPHPTTYLNQERWEDEPPNTQQRESLEDAAARTWDHVHNDLAED